MNSIADGLRRAFDLIAATVGLLLLSPLLIVLGIAIKRGSPGPIFYRAQRIGRGGRPFTLYKFRSMVAEADKRGPAITAAGDSRITPIGHFLRRTKLDELPQLINVVKGEMSLVGPRPEDPRYVAFYTESQRQILAYRPGITSAASLRFRHEASLLSGHDWEQIYREQIMPSKIAIDLAYMANRSIWSDLGLIVRTIWSTGSRADPQLD